MVFLRRFCLIWFGGIVAVTSNERILGDLCYIAAAHRGSCSYWMQCKRSSLQVSGRFRAFSRRRLAQCGPLVSYLLLRKTAALLRNSGCIRRQVRTVKVSNISFSASKREITEFFSFSGDIEYVEMQSESEWSQLAYVTFKDSQGADTAVLLSGATIVDRSVVITPVENYQLPPEAYKQLSGEQSPSTESAVRKAEDVVSSMLAKGFVLSKDALNIARSFDERHNILSNATATVASLDRQYGLSEKINLGRAIVGSMVREVDERYQVSELTKSALVAAEQKASIAGSAIMSNQYVSAGASWLTSTFGMVTKVAGDMSSITKDKVDRAEEDRKAIMWEERNGLVSEYAKIHLDEPSAWEPAILPLESVDEQNLQAV